MNVIPPGRTGRWAMRRHLVYLLAPFVAPSWRVVAVALGRTSGHDDPLPHIDVFFGIVTLSVLCWIACVVEIRRGQRSELLVAAFITNSLGASPLLLVLAMWVIRAVAG